MGQELILNSLPTTNVYADPKKDKLHKGGRLYQTLFGKINLNNTADYNEEERIFTF